MNPTINSEPNGENQAAEELQRTVEMEWSSPVVKRYSRKYGCFSPFKYMALVLDIVPSVIEILIGTWLLSATMYNSTLSTSEQVRFAKPFDIFRSNPFFEKLCRTYTLQTAKNGTEYCERFLSFPVSVISNGTFYTLGAAMILFGVARIILMIKLCRKFPIPDEEALTSKPFCCWCSIYLACVIFEMIGLYLIHVMSYSKTSESAHMDFTFLNDKYDQYYYGFNSLLFYYTYNFACMGASWLATIFAHKCAEHTEVEIYA